LKRKAEIKLPRISLDRSSGIGLANQLCAQLREKILSGKLGHSSRLPSTRALAQSLGVSRNVTMEVYETLVNEELVVSRVGSGTRVRCRAGELMPAAPVRFSPRSLLRESHYPVVTASLRDPDGNFLYVHR
jgi:GntR family transcriptional regulator/MocR family aminotransferase